MEEFNRIKVIHGPSIELIVDNPTELKLVDKGAHGAVFKLSDNKCIKIYAENINAELEAESYRKGQASEMVPRLYEVGANYIIMEFIEGISLYEYLSKKNDVDLIIAKKLLFVLREMKRLGFTRIDSSLRHILVTTDESLKAIDLVYAYVRNDIKPIKIFTELRNLDLVKPFLEQVKKLDINLYNEWVIVMSEYMN
jgi:predicted Ser/Thr protein kinase